MTSDFSISNNLRASSSKQPKNDSIESLIKAITFKSSANKQSIAKVLALLDSQQSSSTSSSTTDQFKDLSNVLNTLHEIDPDALESASEDLKIYKKKNKKASLTDFLALKSQHFSLQYPTSPSGDSLSPAVSSSFSATAVSSTLSKQLYTNHLVQDQVSKITSAFCSDSSIILSEMTDEEIQELINSLLSNGIENIDELEMILQLLGELGIGAHSNLMLQITSAIEDFLESEQSKIADPMAAMQLIEVIKEFVQQQANQGVQIDSLNKKVFDLANHLDPPPLQPKVSPPPLTHFNPDLIESLPSDSIQAPVANLAAVQSTDVSQNASFLEEQRAGSLATKNPQAFEDYSQKDSQPPKAIAKIEEISSDPDSLKKQKSTPIRAAKEHPTELNQEALEKLNDSLDQLLDMQSPMLEQFFTKLLKTLLASQLNSLDL